MAHDRPQRVALQIQRELAALFQKGFRDPRIAAFVTITGVKLSPDLKQATVYYSLMGDETERKETGAGLKAAASFMRRSIGRDLGLRYTPNLRFVFDETIERGDRIDRLLKEVQPTPSSSADGDTAADADTEQTSAAVRQRDAGGDEG